MDYAIGALAGLLLGFCLAVVIGIFKAGGTYRLLAFGTTVARHVAHDPEAEAKIRTIMLPPPPPKPDGTPVRILALLQQDGRLIDFLMDEITSFPDAQIGAAVREIHGQIRKKLAEHVELEPVMPHQEGTDVTVPAGFDPSAIRVVGHVSGEPPYKGVLTHPGWRVKSMKIPEPAEGVDEMVLMPAEVEIPEARG